VQSKSAPLPTANNKNFSLLLLIEEYSAAVIGFHNCLKKAFCSLSAIKFLQMKC